MEILLVLIVLAVITAAAFMYMRSRGGASGLSGRGRGPALRGPRRARRATRDDPMAEAVEHHARATDPHEAADAELHLRAQANWVASDLHAQEASALDSQAARGGGIRGRGAAPGDAHDQPAYDEAGRPVYQEGQPVYQDGQPVYQDDQGRPIHDERQSVYQDEQGRPIHDERQPLPEEQGGPAYHDEHGRPVYPEDRPRY